MSNEELAVLAQAGDGEVLLKLWSQVERLVWKEAHRWAVYGSGGATLEDLTQAGFVALLRAVDTFDPAKAKFTTHLYTYLRAEFSAATNRQTTRTQRDPLQEGQPGCSPDRR